MAKRYAAGALAPLALVLSPACHADWRFTPELELKQTYSDNLRLERREDARGDWVTEITPGFSLSNRSRRFSFDASYRLHYYTLPSDMEGDVDRSQPELAARLKAELLSDLLYFDGNARIAQQPVSVFGPLLSPGEYAIANNAEVRSYSASPYLVRRFGGTANAELRYVLDAVDIGRPGLGNSDSRTASFSLVSGDNWRDLGWDVRLREQRIDDELAPESTSQMASLGLRVPLGRTLALTANAGYDKYDYEALGGTNEGRSWSAGFSWTPTPRTRVDANAGRRYYGSSYFLSANHRTRRTVWSVHYNDEVTSTRAQFLLPSSIDTAAMLDQLFSASITDPAARRRAVEAYMRATGLPPSLANSINYFSNRYFLQKQLQASAAFRTARTRTVLSAFATRRNALSTSGEGTAPVGPGPIGLEENTRQSGASALWNWSLNSRTELNASLNATRAESDLNGFVANHKAARLSLSRQLRSKMSGTVEVRHVKGPTGSLGAEYSENAISAALTMQL
ncbi:MAG: TIGR03016 family PEP-CTERM system-associated outer membrane protein [Telluria sp.]